MGHVKKISPSLLALGRTRPPETVCVRDCSYRFVRFFKHDFFAATALYEGAAGKVVVKFGRRADIFGLPAEWVGRCLAWHESRVYDALVDLESVPEFLGRVGPTAIVHTFVEGRPLARDGGVPDDFFAALRSAINALHDRGMAYVDLEKPQNVLLGDDGKPYLIDFQLAWCWPREHGGETFVARWLRRRFQEGDQYHLLKLQRRVRRDQLTAEQLEASYHKPLYVRVHRRLTAPLLGVRRLLLSRLDPNHGKGERGTVSR